MLASDLPIHLRLKGDGVHGSHSARPQISGLRTAPPETATRGSSPRGQTHGFFFGVGFLGGWYPFTPPLRCL